MASDFAKQLAEQVWGKEPAQYKTIDPELTEAFAEILDEVLSSLGLEMQQLRNCLMN